jgi:hypothetical protein
MVRVIDMVALALLQPGSNFRAPDLIRKKFSGGPGIKETYKNWRKIKREFKMQQHL